MTESVFKMSPRNRPGTASDTTSEGEVGRFRKDSSTASQQSADDLHDLPPIIGAPNSTVAARYASQAETQPNGGPGQKENHHPGGILPLNIRSNSLYESRQGSPSLRRRLKVLIRQKSEPDMLMGRDLGLNSPRMRRMIAPSPPPGDSPRSQSGSDCNSPRIIRKPRSFHGHGSSPRTPKSAENSPRLLRRSMSAIPQSLPQSSISTQSPSSDFVEGIRQARSNSFGSRPDVNQSGPGLPFTMRREANLRKASVNANQTEFLPAVNGGTDGCVTHSITSQDSRRSFASDDDSTGFMSMETIQNSLYEHVSPEDRFGRPPHPLRKPQQPSPPHQLHHDSQQYQQQEGYHHHYHHQQHQHQQHSPPHPHPPNQPPNTNGWTERNSLADCSPPPTNSPTRELVSTDGAENRRESFNSSYSSGSADRHKYDDVPNEDNKRRGNSLYDIEEAREQTDDAVDDKDDPNDDQFERPKMLEDVNVVVEATPQRKDDDNSDIAQPKDEGNNNEIGQHPITNGETNDEVEDDENVVSGDEDEEDEFSDDSYEESVPEYQKAPISTKMRVKKWLAGLENSDNDNASRIDRFLPDIM